MFLRKTLKNGMNVVMEKRELPVVSLSISNPFGASIENSKIKGICHFIEHLVFTGTKTRTHEDISREIELRGGHLNAFTANNVTSFWFKLPSEHIFTGIDIFADMLNNSVFDKENFEKEKKVILEEIKMYHDDPRSRAEEILFENLYSKPFGEGIIGNKESVSSLERDFVFNYFKEIYNPGNFIVSIVGNADFEKVCNYLESKFSSLKSKEIEGKFKLINGEKIEEREGIDQAHLCFGFHAPLAKDKDYYAMEVLNSYLAGGMSAKLFLEIREKRGLAYTVRGSIQTEKDHSYCTIYVGTSKPFTRQVKELILQGFKDVENMTDKELEETKERLIGLKKISSEESLNVMNELAMNEVVDKAESYYNYEENIKNVSLEDVKRLAKIDKYSFSAVVPK